VNVAGGSNPTATKSYLTDALGSVLAMTRADQSPEVFYGYSAYGETQALGVDGDIPNNSNQYTARENDGLVGGTNGGALYYYRARYYDPVLKRFISEDPIGLASGTANFYGYTDGNPASFTDPFGECPWCIGAIIGFGFDIVTQLAQNGGNWSCIDVNQLLVSTALGAIGGGIGGRGLSSLVKSFSKQTKGRIGESLSLLENRLAGSKLIETQARIPGQTTIVDSIWRGLSGSRYYVESKLGTSGLTRAQRQASLTLGDSYRLERWGYPFFERSGAYIGGTAGGLTGSQLLGENCGCR
jgi:RHS repeat-associated protein